MIGGVALLLGVPGFNCTGFWDLVVAGSQTPSYDSLDTSDLALPKDAVDAPLDGGGCGDSLLAGVLRPDPIAAGAALEELAPLGGRSG